MSLIGNNPPPQHNLEQSQVAELANDQKLDPKKLQNDCLETIKKLSGKSNLTIKTLTDRNCFIDDVNSVAGLQALAIEEDISLENLEIEEENLPDRGELQDGCKLMMYDNPNKPNSPKKLLKYQVNWIIKDKTDANKTKKVKQWIYTSIEIDTKKDIRYPALIDNKKLEALHTTRAYVKMVQKAVNKEIKPQEEDSRQKVIYNSMFNNNTLKVNFKYEDNKSTHSVLERLKITVVSAQIGNSEEHVLTPESTRINGVYASVSNKEDLDLYFRKMANNIKIYNAEEEEDPVLKEIETLSKSNQIVNDLNNQRYITKKQYLQRLKYELDTMNSKAKESLAEIANTYLEDNKWYRRRNDAKRLEEFAKELEKNSSVKEDLHKALTRAQEEIQNSKILMEQKTALETELKTETKFKLPEFSKRTDIENLTSLINLTKEE